MLATPEFREERTANGELLFRGLRASIGFAYGRASFQKPLSSTGRADYFGNLPNKAARLMSVAPPGYVVTDGLELNQLLHPCLPKVRAPRFDSVGHV